MNPLSGKIFNAPTAPTSLYIKLPWTRQESVDMIENGEESRAFVYQGNGFAPFTVEGQLVSGLGNIPANGDTIVGGMSAYNKLYDRYYALGSKITIDAVVSYYQTAGGTAEPSGSVSAVLLPISFDHFSTATTSAEFNDSWQNRVNQLLNLDYYQLISIPGAMFRTMGDPSSGSNRWKVSAFRKTKNVYGVKDVTDDTDLMGYMKDTTSNTLGDLDQINPHSGFMWYLRFFNDNTADASVRVNFTVRMKVYAKLTGRQWNVTDVVQDVFP